MIVQVPPGRHFVSYFPAHRVQLAFRKTVPGRFWRALSDRVKLAGEYDLISSYDESAVTEGTRWLDASRSDTSSVSLSWHAARHAYIRTGHHTAWALFGITTAIAVAMVISEALVDN
jgi:hypothetical protein